MPSGTRTRELLSALAILSREAQGEIADLGNQALQSARKMYLKSEMDPSSELLDIDTVTPPVFYRKALERLATFTHSGTLQDVNETAVYQAQTQDPWVIQTLCAVAGMTYKELRDRADGQLPNDPGRAWSVTQISAAFNVIDRVVRGTVKPRNPTAVARRPVEMLFADEIAPRGWDLIEQLRAEGAPYETLLAQRVVGTSWGAHRNSTSSKVQAQVTDELCRLLEEHEVPYRRLKRDKAAREALAALAVARDQVLKESLNDTESVSAQVTVLAEPAGHTHAIAVSVATDGGTANKSGGKLLQLPPKFRVPVAVVLIGPGWAKRTESAELVHAFDGRTYTELTLDQLVRDMLPDDVA
ncbi:hypothetical protein GCM10023193_22780 [Planotetraspora kaengkrachanensis]|uniref:Uncharacterized protein n=2 Tax=Planotetraspora kaengkrachanensis TaxID=575193 RepID=A0A8J3LY54_9ACTN|nr:hypothetical protein Pka01_31360 [Planotetraspora kaengkrachanensis]